MKLLKVVIQAVMVEEVDGFLHERVAEPISVPASEWRRFAAEGGTFDQSLAKVAEV